MQRSSSSFRKKAKQSCGTRKDYVRFIHILLRQDTGGMCWQKALIDVVPQAKGERMREETNIL